MLFLNRTNFRNNSNICNYWWMDCHGCFCWRFTLYLGCSRWCHLSIDSRSQTRRKHWGVIIILFTIFPPFFLFLLWGGYVDCLSIAEGNALQQVVVKLGGLAFLVETRWCPYPFFSWLSEFVLSSTSLYVCFDLQVGPLRCWPGGLCLSRSIGDMDVGEFIVPIPYVKQVKVSIYLLHYFCFLFCTLCFLLVLSLNFFFY